MELTKVHLVQTIRRILFSSTVSLPQREQIENIEDPVERKEIETAVRGYEHAIMQQVNQLLQELDPTIEPPDITNPDAIEAFVEKLSRMDLNV